MLCVTIPDEFLYPVVPAILMLMAWIVRELGRTSAANDRMEVRLEEGEKRMDRTDARLDHHDGRIRDLERGDR